MPDHPSPTVSAPAAGSSAEVNFFRNYNRVVAAAFAAIMALTLAFLAYQAQRKYDQELQTISGHVARHSLFVEYVLRSSIDQLLTLRERAQAQLSQSGVLEARALRLAGLRETPAGFDRDALVERDSGANLTGAGRLSQRSADFNAELRAALALDDVFGAILFHLPSATQASFIGQAGLAAISPWQESARKRFALDLFELPLWQQALPASNPQRERRWAPVSDGGREVGLQVPVGAPVYAGDRFHGVVAIHTSLDYLNRIHADFGYPLGTPMLVDANGVVLAHPQLARLGLALREPQTLAQMLPPELADLPARLPNWPSDVSAVVAGHWVSVHRFDAAPWLLIYSVPQRALWEQVLSQSAPAMGLMLLGLAALIVVMYGVTAREFVGPATQLVRHLAMESQFHPQPVPRVPFAWRPWFETVSKAFRESLQLISLRQELDIAAKMQRAILPHHWPRHPNYQLWGVMRPAKEVGGDFYDHFELGDGRLGLVVADVSGKGVPAALFGMVSKTLIRATALRGGIDCAQVMTLVNDALCQDNDSCMFVTAFYAHWDAQTGWLEFVNAGHPPPLWLHADGRCEFLSGSNDMALGVMDGLDFHARRIQVQPGERLVIYTDGVTEAFDAQLQEFGPQRLLALYQSPPAGDAQASVQTLVAAVDAYAGQAPQSDDLTAVVLCAGPLGDGPHGGSDAH